MEDLPKILRDERKLKNTCGRQIFEYAQRVLDGDESVIQDLQNQNLTRIKFKINLNILLRKPIPERSKDQTQSETVPIRNFAAEFNFIHFLVILGKTKILKSLNLLDDVILSAVSVTNVEEVVRRKDAWIFGATSVHLAAMFSHKALKVLIEKAKNKDLIMSHPNSEDHRSISPMHVAAMSHEPLSIK